MFIQCPLDAVRWATHLMISASTPAPSLGGFQGLSPAARRPPGCSLALSPLPLPSHLAPFSRLSQAEN